MTPIYDTERRDFSITTPLMEVEPEKISILTVSSGVMAHYQKQMSKAVWRPAPGRKLGFLVTQDEHLLGLIFLASPVLRLSARDSFLFPGLTASEIGKATRQYMDMSVCVASQPIAWHWNLGKLTAMLAPTLGDYVQARYPDDEFKGVTTTSLYGKSVQYNRIYKFLGYTKGHGHEHIDDIRYAQMKKSLRDQCPHCTPGCPADGVQLFECGCNDCKSGHSKHEPCAVPSSRFGSGANARMRIISAYKSAIGGQDHNGEITLRHGFARGVYYHRAVTPSERPYIINDWYWRWGLPRYYRTRNQIAPYQNGTEGLEKEHRISE